MGWRFVADNVSTIDGRFDDSGNARECNISPRGREFTFTVFDQNGRPVPGGGGIPTRGGSIMTAEWR